MADNIKGRQTAENAEDEDDIHARFAFLERPENQAADDELPPVPTVNIERPSTQTAQKDRPAASGPSVGVGSVLGGRMLTGGGEGNLRSTGQAMTIGTSLVASIIVGTLFGWLADKYLLHSAGTPWGLIVGFMLGTASGFVNLIRVANQLNRDDSGKR